MKNQEACSRISKDLNVNIYAVYRLKRLWIKNDKKLTKKYFTYTRIIGEKLWLWYSNTLFDKNKKCTEKILKQKALEIAFIEASLALNRGDDLENKKLKKFKASRKWLRNWKLKYQTQISKLLEERKRNDNFIKLMNLDDSNFS